ncbi:MAG TPA: LacI family DNA-binding transcriptional regulator, partial [Gemmatimonadaceae bacterium]|nr:LacI family DNA-binding transcriptional regulator [Gemmatimonadaceae bacterium]
MPSTIRDVARAAGVSVATVSRVLNASGPVGADTRERVRAAARRLRYVPHEGARGLVTRRTGAIGVVLPDLYGEFFSEVIRGLDQAARRHGYHLLLSSSHADLAEMQAALATMRGRVDGLVAMLPDLDAAALREHLPSPDQLPVVLLNRAAGGHAALTVDNYGGARAMTRHLLDLGHRRVAMITGAASNSDARERLRGYRAELRRAGIPPERALEVTGEFTEEGGHAAARRLVALPPAERPTAIFAANDAMAIGALSALREVGLRVPEDVAVTGFDDIPMARFVEPPLTSVHVPIGRLGERAVERLVAAMREPDARAAPAAERCATTLVIRRSCGAPAPHPAIAVTPAEASPTRRRPR